MALFSVVTFSHAAFADSPLAPLTFQPTAQEATLSPLLDLYNGGQAVGSAQGHIATPEKPATSGTLMNGSELPEKGVGFENIGERTDDWGSGLMVSFIMNAGPLVAAANPGSVMRVGAIAQQYGGAYAPHTSHQNGLDADVLFMGAKDYSSVLDGQGNVTSKFDVEKNWSVWKIATSQQLATSNGKPTTAVSMILVDPRIKTFICSWAKSREATLDALDYEVLRRLRPTAGHDNHFHLRFKCSPHYASCVNGGEGRSTLTGCTEFDPKP